MVPDLEVPSPKRQLEGPLPVDHCLPALVSLEVVKSRGWFNLQTYSLTIKDALQFRVVDVPTSATKLLQDLFT